MALFYLIGGRVSAPGELEYVPIGTFKKVVGYLVAVVWLYTNQDMASKKDGFTLQKSEFRDALCTRYGWRPLYLADSARVVKSLL